MDNTMAENFFAQLKTEMYHGKDFKDVDALINSK
ncbi:TPA: IS3 family transposase [Photobacterium damselae]